MKQAIITGVYGYIGSVLSKYLRTHGYHVIGIDNDPNADHDWMRKSPIRLKYCNDFYGGCFASEQALKIINQNSDATVFHLAANSLLGPSAYQPLTYFRNNTSKTIVLLEALKPSNKLVFASTAAVYAPTNIRCKETSKIGPINNYGLSKLWCEQAIDSCYKISNLRATSFRFFNVIGAYGDVGQQPNTPHIINQLCKSAAEKIPFVINGDKPCYRDYFHIIDCVRALEYAASTVMESEDPCHHKFNLGSGYGFYIKQVVENFELVSGYCNYTFGPARPGDPPKLIANNKKFMKTGFKYQHNPTKGMLVESTLRETIRSAWEYYNR